MRRVRAFVVWGALGAVSACGPSRPEPARPDVAKVETERAAVFKTWMAAQEAEAAKRQAEQRRQAIAVLDAAPDCDDRFQFIPGEQLSADDLGKATRVRFKATVSSPTAPHRLRLGYQVFDDELPPPLHGRWTAVARIQVRGDADDRRLLQGVVWTQPRASNHGYRGPLDEDFMKTPDGVVLIVSTGARYWTQEMTTPICVGRFRLKLTKDGVLYAGGKKVADFR